MCASRCGKRVQPCTVESRKDAPAGMLGCAPRSKTCQRPGGARCGEMRSRVSSPFRGLTLVIYQLGSASFGSYWLGQCKQLGRTT